jgi:anti-sigma regulatory factor (Ser/Thr protein kinase)
MTTQDFTDHADSDFADIDARFAELLAELDWLGPEGTRLARLGLRNLRRNLRTYTFPDLPVDIVISATATSSGVTVVLEDSGPEVRGVERAGRPDPAGCGDHRLRILDQAFDQITYDRLLDRNRWVLRRFADPAASSV